MLPDGIKHIIVTFRNKWSPLYNAVHKKRYQAHNFVIDGTRAEMYTEAQLLEYCKDAFYDARLNFIKRIVLVWGDRILIVLERA